MIDLDTSFVAPLFKAEPSSEDVIPFPFDCFATRKRASLKRRAGW